MSKICEELKQFSFYDWLLMAGVTAVFLPQVLCVVLLVGLLLVLLVRGDLLPMIKEQKGKFFAYGFFLLELVVSLFYHNWIGAQIIFSFLLLILYMAFYHTKIHPKLFSYLIEWSLILSFVVCVIGLVQFNYISEANGYHFLDFHIFNSPKRRIYSTFQNANILALMIEFMLACCLYRFLETERIGLKAWYVFLALFEFAVLLLTGCRAALVPLIFVIPVMLILNGKKRLLGIYTVFIVILLSIIYMYPSLIPRLDDFSTIASRFKIWKTSIKGIQLYPLFGNGPWTYFHIYKMFDGHKAVFCHNIYLNCISSYGIVGTLFLLGYLRTIFFQVKATASQNRLLFSLMIALCVIVGIHGLVDGTINPLKTNLFLLMILSSDSLYRNQKKNL